MEGRSSNASTTVALAVSAISILFVDELGETPPPPPLPPFPAAAATTGGAASPGSEMRTLSPPPLAVPSADLAVFLGLSRRTCAANHG